MTRGPGVAVIKTEERPWHTGTSADQFTPIYMAMAVAGKYHGPIPPPLVDQMDLTTIAALMGIGEREAQQRDAHDRYRGADPEVPMVPKSQAQAPGDGSAILTG